MSEALVLHRWTRANYDRAVEAGLFENMRVELLYGNIVDMSPTGSTHASSVQELTELLVGALKGRAKVRIQMPFAASDHSEPEPDVTVAPPGKYRDAHPSKAWLIIESAESSLNTDRGPKAELYAESGVAEYWIVNLVDAVIEVHTEIVVGRYQRVVPFKRGDAITLQQFPDVTIAVSDVIG